MIIAYALMMEHLLPKRQAQRSQNPENFQPELQDTQILKIVETRYYDY